MKQRHIRLLAFALCPLSIPAFFLTFAAAYNPSYFTILPEFIESLLVNTAFGINMAYPFITIYSLVKAEREFKKENLQIAKKYNRFPLISVAVYFTTIGILFLNQI